MAAKDDTIAVQVAYALPDSQRVVDLRVRSGATIGEAIEKSGLLEHYPDINLGQQAVGVFGVLRALGERVEAGDRVEIYRPLLADPKEARRRRAGQGRSGRPLKNP